MVIEPPPATGLARWFSGKTSVLAMQGHGFECQPSDFPVDPFTELGKVRAYTQCLIHISLKVNKKTTLLIILLSVFSALRFLKLAGKTVLAVLFR